MDLSVRGVAAPGRAYACRSLANAPEPAAAGGPIDIPALIRSRLGRLSPNDRRIASWLLENFDAAPFETADSLARQAGVSKAAVVRFGTKLGFGGYAGLHEAIVAGTRVRLARASAGTPTGRGGILDRWLAACTADLAATRAALGDGLIESAADLLGQTGGRTYVFGQRKSAALAEYAFFLLNPVLGNVQALQAGPSTVADNLLGVGPEDRLLAFTFRRYARLTFQVVDYVAQAGGAVVLVTDDGLIAPAAQARHVLVCAPESPGPFASAVGGLFAVEALAACIAERAAAEGRLEAAEQLWDRFGPY